MALPLLLALLMGASLVALGAGGSIVTVPLLVYAAGLDAHLAAGTSLLVVGTVALAGALASWRYVAVRSALVFGASGMLAAWPGVWLNHRAPEVVVLVGLGVTMLVVAVRMLAGSGGGTRRLRPQRRTTAMVAGGLAVGLMTGFFGVGGGFLIVPALSLVLGLGMVEAVATSLLVIALNSAAGLVGHLWYGTVDWRLGASLATAALLGAAVALPLVRRIPPVALQRAFAGLLVLVGTGMLAATVRELLA